MNNPEWQELADQLQAPFDPRDVEFRPQGSLNDKGQGRAIAYVDARVVAERLDEVFGPLGWSFTWDPLIQDTLVRVVRGVITINGISKSDIGDGDQTEVSKAAVSDALKRTAVLFGVGRYLYTLSAEWVEGKPMGKGWVIAYEEIARLRSKLPRPKGMEPPANRPPAQASTGTRPPAQESTQGRTAPAPPASERPLRAVGASTHEPAPAQASGDPLQQARARVKAKAEEWSWGRADLEAVLHAHVQPGLSLAQANRAQMEALEAVLRDKGVAALPSLAGAGAHE